MENVFDSVVCCFCSFVKCGFWFFGSLVFDRWKLCSVLLRIFLCLVDSVVYLVFVVIVLYFLYSVRFWLMFD